ncbi:hypothetical protein GCM10017566_50690 [Amycolatopsis bartoniae]|uniref:Uncharacterized protein n=1 Tax=Amycolatopsis bartoniae TaxID=941986 RepID=A0A8H9IVH6_9PSEU|nr:hypothetical protein GCM10017566_50690 [Amycolatopsis bartoniae]
MRDRGRRLRTFRLLGHAQHVGHVAGPQRGVPAGLEKMFRHAGRDLREPRPEGFGIRMERLVEAAELAGNVVLGPPR